ncbi:MAG: AmmeMemoRadiSam system radical SAM enzyme [Methanimicrococcus sp.]|nr:AmmeMemoRadiSam system radical SAM enzyme [Methanimicrococcus sp.]
MISPVKEALLYEKYSSGNVRCGVCARKCVIAPDKTGFCRVRKNIGGTLYALNYGFVSSEAIDPIEKKPLYHFLPGTTTYSLGTFGCNFRCLNCQNHKISMPSSPVYESLYRNKNQNRFGEIITPEEVVTRALLLETKSVSLTYNEPAVWFEFVYDLAVLAQKSELSVVLVTNGYLTPEALEMLAPHIDGYCVDLKSFSDSFYSDICSAKLDPVLESVLKAKELNLHIEIVTLIIPGMNDDVSEAKAAAEWISSRLGKEVPIHLNAFLPHYKMEQTPRTPDSTLNKIRAVYQSAGLDYVYIGNTISEYKNTYCPNCQALLINRVYSFGESVHLEKSENEFVCSNCRQKVPLFCPPDIHF